MANFGVVLVALMLVGCSSLGVSPTSSKSGAALARNGRSYARECPSASAISTPPSINVSFTDRKLNGQYLVCNYADGTRTQVTLSYSPNDIKSVKEFRAGLVAIVDTPLTPLPGIGAPAFEYTTSSGQIDVAVTNDHTTILVTVVGASGAVAADIAKAAVAAGGH